MSANRPTQSQRRARTRGAVFNSACRLFGADGYAATSLEAIAEDCGLTTRPIYHYFGNKIALFTAVNAQMEHRVLEVIGAGERPLDLPGTWSRFLDLCADPGFRRIVLIDGPNLLGRQRWQTSPVVQLLLAAADPGEQAAPELRLRRQLQTRMTISALAEAAMMVAEASDSAMARHEAEAMIKRLLPRDRKPSAP